MIIRIHPHARERMRERGATADEVKETIRTGSAAAAKFGRTRFRRTFAFNSTWQRTRYAAKQIDAFAAIIKDGWLVVTVIVKYF